MKASTVPVLHWTCPFPFVSGAIEGDFLRSVADVLMVSFRARTEKCLCGNLRPGSCSVVVTPMWSAPITALHRAKSVRGAASSSYGHATCLSPPLSLSRGRSEEGGEGCSGVGCLNHWDVLRGDVQAERGVYNMNKRVGLFWGWLLRVVEAALVSRLGGRGCGDVDRGCGDGEATVGSLNHEDCEVTTTMLKQDKQGT